MYTIDQVKKYLKGKTLCYHAIWSGEICKHVYIHFYYFVIQDGKVISRHKVLERAKESQKKNPFSVIKTAFDLKNLKS